MKPDYKTIYLVPTDIEAGQITYSWCDCSAPGEGMDKADAIKYVRADVVEAQLAALSNDVLARRVAELSSALLFHQNAGNQCIKDRDAAEQERDEALATVEQFHTFAESWNPEDAAKDPAFSDTFFDLINQTPTQALADLKAEVAREAYEDGGSAQKAFWDGFERGAISGAANIRQHWNEYLQIRQAAVGGN